jgi:hypothetical protein
MVQRYDVILRGILLRRFALLALGLVAFASLCRAEPRWCTVAGIADGKNLLYPPIARAARVYGVVLERVIYLPNGAVQSFEYITGPKMLAGGLEQQMKAWRIVTSAQGDQACVSLVIADFSLDETSGELKLYPADLSVPSILRLKASADIICLCDPGGYVSKRSILRRWMGKIKRKLLSGHTQALE